MVKSFGRCMLILAALWPAFFVQATTISFTDAKQQGSFNIGAAKVSMSREGQEAQEDTEPTPAFGHPSSGGERGSPPTPAFGYPSSGGELNAESFPNGSQAVFTQSPPWRGGRRPGWVPPSLIPIGVHRDWLIVDYSIPDQTVGGVWAKEFPAQVANGSVDVIDLNIEFPETASVAVAVEIKGSSGTQRVPLRLRPGWNTTRELLDWKKIGSLNETVLLIQRVGGENPATGRIRLEMTFQKLPLWERLRATLWGRLAGVRRCQ